MTVAAVILSATTEGALAPVEGVPRVRRLADLAWSGGAIPVVVVAHDPEGSVAGALAGSAAVLASPAPAEAGPVGQIVRGIAAAAEAVSGTEAAIIWPARFCWVDAETLTSLIEAHGMDRATALRPAYRGEPGWPVLLPLEHLSTFQALDPGRMPDRLIDDLSAAGVAVRLLELGDPGATHNADTPRRDLPAFEGPPEPPAGHRHEWGAVAAERPDDAPPDLPPTIG